MFRYDPKTGIFTHFNTGKRVEIVAPMSRQVQVKWRRYTYIGARVAWKFVYGEDPGRFTKVAFKDEDPQNLAIDNLYLIEVQSKKKPAVVDRYSWAEDFGDPDY